MKAGIAIMLTALRALRAGATGPGRRLIWLMTSDEEIGSPSSRPVIEHLAQQSDYVLVLEPGRTGDGALRTTRKGVGAFRLSITGLAAHAGAYPARGVSAIVELAHQVLRLEQLVDLTAGTTINVGWAQGGTRKNVVAGEAVAEIDLRVISQAEAERVVPRLLALRAIQPGATVRVTGGLGRPPMERSTAIGRAFERASAIGAALGLRLIESGAAGGSDGNFTAALGIPTLDGLGGVGGGAHARHEQVTITSLIERSALLAALLEHL